MMYSVYFIGGPFDLTKRIINAEAVEIHQYFYIVDEEYRCSTKRWEYSEAEKANLKKHRYKLIFRRDVQSKSILFYEYVGVID